MYEGFEPGVHMHADQLGISGPAPMEHEALLTALAVTLAGVQQATTAVASSDTFVPTADRFLVVINGGGSPDVVAFVTPGTTRGLAIADAGGSVTNATTKVFGPFPAELFADPTTGLCTVTHTFITSVTCVLYEIQRP